MDITPKILKIAHSHIDLLAKFKNLNFPINSRFQNPFSLFIEVISTLVNGGWSINRYFYLQKVLNRSNKHSEISSFCSTQTAIKSTMIVISSNVIAAEINKYNGMGGECFIGKNHIKQQNTNEKMRKFINIGVLNIAYK